MPRPISLSFDLLQTFLRLVRNEGDASTTAEELDINQPSMSKRLRYLQHAGDPLPRPWLVRKGKKWELTDEGRRVLPAVREIVHRYEQLTQFIDKPAEKQLRFACGQADVLGFVKQAVQHYRRRSPEVALRVSTLRGADRIEGVASGSLDLACVAYEEADILTIARRPLYVEPILKDRFVLVCSERSRLAADFEKLNKKSVSLQAFSKLRLILPERNSSARRLLDSGFRNHGVRPDELNILLEIGGWSAIISYVHSGIGVGIVSERAVRNEKKLIMRTLDPAKFPPRCTRLICRRLYGTGEELDLSEEAADFRETLLWAAREQR